MTTATTADPGRAVDGARRARPLLAATALSVTGDGMFATAAALLAAAITRNPVMVALVATVMFGTRIVFGIPFGALADRWPRRRVMIAADLARAVTVAALTVLVFAHAATIGMLLATVAAVTALSCLFSPASQAVIPEVIGQDKKALDTFNGRYWMVYSTGRDLAGPPLGAVAFAAARALPFLADAVSFVCSAALIRRLPRSRPPAARQARPAVTAGLRHVLGTPALRVMTFGVAGDNLASACVLGIFVLYCRETLHLPAAAYGLLVATGALAAVAAGVKPDLLVRRLSGRKVIAVCALAQAGGWAVLAVFPSIWAAVLGMLILGAAGVWAGGTISTVFQTNTPQNMRGAAWAACSTFAVGAAGVGALAGGVVAGAAGLNAAVILAAVLAAATGAAVLATPRRGHGGGT
jgi:MFS family permease